MTKCFRAATVLGILVSAVLISTGQQPGDDDGIDVQTRGPIHEAYAQPASSNPIESLVVPKKPPEPINELPPDMKPEGDHMIWIPGYWAFDEERGDYLWVSGIWRDTPPDRNWMPGYWAPVEDGWRWTSGYWAGRNETSVELLPPPPQPVEEAIAPPPNANMIYVPGIWVFRETNFLWRPGHWIPAQAGWVWTPAHYCWTPGGYVFHNGYWDLELDDRGVCFAPIFVEQRFYGRPNWFYRPRQVIRTDFLMTSLFVHLGFRQYFFGDYYDAGYARRGFTPWVDYRVRGNTYDPLYSHYRWKNRDNDRWEKDLRTVYATRRDDKAQRPPRTLVQQQKVVVNNVVNNNLTVVMPVEKVKITNVKMVALPKEQAVQINKNVQQIRAVSQQRVKVEAQAKANKTAKTQTVKIDLPQPAIKLPAAKQKAPPIPDSPKVSTKTPTQKDFKFKDDDKKPDLDKKFKDDDKKPGLDKKPNFDKKPDLDKKPNFDKKPDLDKKPKDFDKKPDLDKKPNFDKKPDFDKKPNFDKKPDFDKKPKDLDKTPKDFDKKPKEVEKKPKDEEKKPKEVEKKPKEVEKKPKDGDGKGNDKKKNKDDDRLLELPQEEPVRARIAMWASSQIRVSYPPRRATQL